MESKHTEILQELSGAIEGVAAAASLSVVSVSSNHGMGTGTILDDRGRVLTASHVVHGLSEVEVGFDGASPAKARVLGRNPHADLALLEVQSKGLVPIQLGSSANLKVGQFVLALGTPRGGAPSVTSGIVTGVNRQVGGWWRFSVRNAIVTDARLNQGYSGGPLLDAAGRMIGMNVAYAFNRGIAVPVDAISKEIERLARGEGPRRAYLGIVSNPISLPDDVARRPDVNQDGGLMIFSVEPGSAAKKGGLALGDVLVRFGDLPVNSFQDLESQLGEESANKQTKVVVLRGEQLKELFLTPTLAD